MRAVILAAGFGKRMMPLTANTHKCLLEIGGQPVLKRIVDGLEANGVTDLTIVTGYLADELRQFMQDTYPDRKVQWIHNEHYQSTNNIYSLSLALEQISGEDVILIECDLVFDPSIISRLLQAEHDAVALVSAYEPGMDGTVVSLSRDVITAIHPPHLQGEDFVFSNKFKTLNIYRFSKAFIETSLRMLTSFYARSINNNCYYELVLGVMIYMQSSEIHAIIVDTSLWSEIDDPVDMQGTEYKFNVHSRQQSLDTTHGAYWNYPVEDFCYVQNAYFPNEGMYSMLRHHLPLLMKNFGSSQVNMERKLSFLLECDQNKVVLLNGSSQAFPWMREYFSGKRILLPAPTFGEYSRMFPQASVYADQVGVDTDALSKKISEHDVIVFVNPNNPTGSAIDSSYIESQIIKHPDKIFIVDESFIDFSEQPSVMSFLHKDPNCKNALLLKSLGKSWGVPGLRLGYIYSNNDSLLDKLRYCLPIWNINSIAEYFLELLLKNRRSLDESFALVKKARMLLEQRLGTVPYIEKVYPSQANFLLCRIHSDGPADLTKILLERHNIYIKDVSPRFNEPGQYVRFAVRRTDSNELLIQALQEIAKQADRPFPSATGLKSR